MTSEIAASVTRRSRWFAVWVVLLALLNATAGFAAGNEDSAEAWLFTSFRDSGDGLHLAYSVDARNWTDLNRAFLKPVVGSRLMRDPHILRGADGLYHMVWTSGWHDRGIGYANSSNLLNWSEQRFIPLMETVAGTETCWAPELYFDEKSGSYVIVWSSSAPLAGFDRPQHRAYYTLTKDFRDFTKPQILFDPGFNNIDTTMIRRGDKFVIVLKETDDQPNGKWGAVYAAEADQLLGPYTLIPEPIIKNERVEGPALATFGNKTLLYVDYYANHRYGMLQTTDWKKWSDATGSASIVPGQRHGSIFSVPTSLLTALRKDELEAMARAPKPILEGYTADPAIRVFGDTYYVYPTSDRPNWNTTEFAVWSSKNLVTWKKEGVFMDLTKDLSWATNKAWAPDCIERDGKYYFYFCANHNIGVAVGETPIGPFKDALGRPLIEDDKIKTFSIDPSAFIDDDGQAYLYFGNGTPTVFKLNPDMISLAGSPVEIRLRQFREGIVVFKRQGKYYFMWSIDDARSPNYRVGWGIADSPFGPVQSPDHDFIVLQKNGPAVGTAHHSVVNVPGTDRWYVAYHRHAIPNGNGYQRETCLVRMEFNPDGTIKPMDPMTSPFKPGEVGEPIKLQKP
jgi:GH43 family beta-xylosidase